MIAVIAIETGLTPAYLWDEEPDMLATMSEVLARKWGED